MVKAVETLIHSSKRQETIVRNALRAASQFHISNVASHLRTLINETNDKMAPVSKTSSSEL